MTTTRRPWITVALAATLLAGCDRLSLPTGASFKGVDITGATYSYTLPDQNGTLRTPGDFQGKVTAVFFGYTQCPDVCPTTMAELSQVKRALGDDGTRMQGIFVTVDPERDTGPVLKAYVDNFNAGFIGLRGSAEQTKEVAREFKVFYAKVPGKTESTYTIDHTAGSYIFDTQGRIRLFSRYNAGPKALEDDIRSLLRETA